MRPPPAREDEAHVSAAAALQALAVETVRAGEMCERLGDLVERLVRTCEGEELKIAMQEAQAVDALTQHLAALAGFAGRLADRAEGVVAPAEALRAVPLADLAARLSAACGGEVGSSD
ncbi:hypothetical protein, partial [Caulobacter sp. 17J65-9]|uniref:hypothetical protein n=1 Tax=Caulobacter sp. 17J65-9 TaxID=2709382 RepID=UPI0013C95FA0